MPNVEDYMQAIFGEISTAAGRSDLLPRLKTRDLPVDIRADQLRKLSKTRLYGGPPEPLVGGGFVMRLITDGRVSLIVYVQHLNDAQELELDDLISSVGGAKTDFEIYHFCSIALYGSPYYRIQSELRSEEAAIDKIDLLSDPHYLGHDILEVRNWFERVSVYEILPESAILESSGTYISALLACNHKGFRSGLIGDEICAKMAGLLDLHNVNPENLYLSQTTSHWKHAFLEIYKLLEAIYYLPWVVNLRDASGMSSPALQLAQHCRAGLAWREKEKASIRKLFEMAVRCDPLRQNLISTSIFNGMDTSKLDAGGVAERIYKVRNQLVHQEDYEERVPLLIDQSFWPEAVEFLVELIEELYSSNASDTAYSFSLTSAEISRARS